MPSASTIRLQIETALAHKIPSALSPAPKIIRPIIETGIEPLDELLEGGIPVGALTEFVGTDCAGLTSTALSFLSRITQANKVCAWVDISNSFDPPSAAAAGVNLARLLWIRCGNFERKARNPTSGFVLPNKYLMPRVSKEGLHGGGFGPHPRTEVNGLSDAIGELMQSNVPVDRCELMSKPQPKQKCIDPREQVAANRCRTHKRSEPWSSIVQGLKSTDLLLQSGGFSAIVLDMAGLLPEVVSRIELSTWHRYRLAAERTQASIVLLTQYSCGKSSSELQLRFLPAEDIGDEPTIFTGIQPRAEVRRRRFAKPATNLVDMRKSPQKETVAFWRSRTTWAGPR